MTNSCDDFTGIGHLFYPYAAIVTILVFDGKKRHTILPCPTFKLCVTTHL